MLARYSINGSVYAETDDSFQLALNHAHSKKLRPMCLCRDPAIEMYIARIDGKFYVKRMPNSGRGHDPMCVSYDPPPELSGLGSVLGNAISEEGEEGGTALRVDFSLSRRPGARAAALGGGDSDSVKTDANKLTLRSTLHYLWDQAGFNRWMPRMEGKRSWRVIRRHLLDAAEGKKLKGQSLGEVLYIPEAWNKDEEADQNARRDQMTAKLIPSTGGAHTLMLCVGECKSLDQTAYGYKITVKHAPTFGIFFNEEIYKRIKKRFEVEMALKDLRPDAHLMFIATFGLSVARTASLDEVSFMLCSKDYIPIETIDDVNLIEALVAHKRTFVKGLRYNVPSKAPLASAVLLDTIGKETALYVIPPGATEVFKAGIEELRTHSNLPSFVWDVGDAPAVPALPPMATPASRHTARSAPAPQSPLPSPPAAPAASGARA